jgi:hypothetical protein
MLAMGLSPMLVPYLPLDAVESVIPIDARIPEGIIGWV